MKKTKYTKEQQKLLSYAKKKVEKLFIENSVPGHGISHIRRVVGYTKKIITQEEVEKPFLCELSAWLHDIGRVLEDVPGESSRKHHELSYDLLKKWFIGDNNFDVISNEDKIELLYSVRYHWNDVADKFESAWILRDADKLDLFGKAGLCRAREVFKGDDIAWNQHFRNLFGCYYFFKTKTAKKIVNKLMPETEKENRIYLQSKIEKVEL